MHSILFKIGPIPVRAYGFFLWIGLLSALFISLRLAKRTNIKSDQVTDSVLCAVISGIIGAHVFSILLDLPYYIKNPSEITGLWSGVLSTSGGLRGLSFHGGLISAIIAVWIYTSRKKINFLALADILSPGLAIAYGVTRIGCFLNGCCYGIPSGLPWGVRFYTDISSCTLTPPSHPTQIYSMLSSFAIFGVLLLIRRHSRFDGMIFSGYLILYAVYRFMIEFLRKGVTAEVAFCGLTQAQIVSILMLMIFVPFFFWKFKHSKPIGQESENRKTTGRAM